MTLKNDLANIAPPTPTPTGNGKDERLFHAVAQQTRFEKLHDRFKQKDFVTENRFWRFAALVTSIIINLLSIFGAFYAANTLFSKFGASEGASMALSCVLLVLVELARRKAADSIWDKYFKLKKLAFGFLALNLFLLAISTAFGGYGIHAKIIDSAPPPPTVVDTVLIKMESELAALRTDNETAKRTKWRGTVTVDAQRAMKNNSKAIADLTASINERRARHTAKQDETSATHEQQYRQAAFIAVGVFVFLEILFQACFAFMSYFDWREYVLRTEQGQNSVWENTAPQHVGISADEMRRLMANTQTGGMYPLNIINPAFAAFMQPPQTPQTQGANLPPFAGANPFDKRAQSDFEQPQTQGANEPKTVFIPTDITVEHKDGTTGKTKHLNITQVRANLSANRTHLKKAATEERIKHFSNCVAYWQGKESELIAKYAALEQARKPF